MLWKPPGAPGRPALGPVVKLGPHFLLLHREEVSLQAWGRGEEGTMVSLCCPLYLFLFLCFTQVLSFLTWNLALMKVFRLLFKFMFLGGDEC